jgi:hypothetical protein
MTDLQAKAVIDAINEMFKGKHFSICTVDDCMKVTGAVRTSDYDALRLYHCRDFAKMDRETKEYVFKATIENVCNVDAFPEIKLVKPSEAMGQAISVEQKPLIKRLLRLA